MTNEVSKSGDGKGGFKPGWAAVFTVLGVAAAEEAVRRGVGRWDRRHRMAALSDRVSYVESDKLGPGNDTLRAVLAACLQYPDGATRENIKSELTRYKSDRRGALPIGECVRLLREAQVLHSSREGVATVNPAFVSELVMHHAEAPKTLAAIALSDGWILPGQEFEATPEFLQSLNARLAGESSGLD